jgi:hypothetical protein
MSQKNAIVLASFPERIEYSLNLTNHYKGLTNAKTMICSSNGGTVMRSAT